MALFTKNGKSQQSRGILAGLGRLFGGRAKTLPKNGRQQQTRQPTAAIRESQAKVERVQERNRLRDLRQISDEQAFRETERVKRRLRQEADEVYAIPEAGEEAPVGEGLEYAEEAQLVDQAPWTNLTSSNVAAARYGRDDFKLQIRFHGGSVYEYDDVEPEVAHGLFTTGSPGGWVWYVLRQYSYPYRKISEGTATQAAPPRFDGKPFLVPDNIQAIQDRAGRTPSEGEKPLRPTGTEIWNQGTPKSGKPKNSAWNSWFK